MKRGILFTVCFLFSLLLHAGKLEILATADWHGEIGKLALLAPHFRAHPDAVKVDAGDLVQGNPAIFFADGYPMIDALNALGCHIFVPGNHDFEMGEAILGAWQKRFAGTMLCAQCRGPHFKPAPFTTVKRDGICCAFIGVTEAKCMNFPALLPEYTVRQETLAALDAALQEIRALSPAPDAVVLIWHNGRYSSIGTLGRILSERPEIDVVICAHTHEVVPGAKAGHAVAVQPGAHGAGAILLTVTTGENRGKWITSQFLRPGETPDPEIAAIGKKAEKNAQKPFSRLIGDFPGQREFAECAAEAIRREMGCDAVIFDAPANFSGRVTVGRFFSAFLYNNRYFAVTLSREEFQAVAKESPGKGRIRTFSNAHPDSFEVTAALSDHLIRSSPTLRRKKLTVVRPGICERDIPRILNAKGDAGDETGN